MEVLLLEQQRGTTGGSSFKTPKGNSVKNMKYKGKSLNLKSSNALMTSLKTYSKIPSEIPQALSTSQHKGNSCKQMNHRRYHLLVVFSQVPSAHHCITRVPRRHEAVGIPRASVAATPVL